MAVKKIKSVQDSSKQSRTKRSDKNQDKNRWRKAGMVILAVAIAVPLTFIPSTSERIQAILAMIAALSFVMFVGIVIELYVWKEKHARSRRLLRAACTILAVAIIGMTAVLMLNPLPNPPEPFVAEVKSSAGSYLNERGGLFWVIYNRGQGDVVTPAQLGLYVEIISHLPRDAVINGYVVEAQNKSSEWFKLIRVDASISQVFLCIKDLREAKPIDLSNGLDRQLVSKPIGPHGTVKGWALFELPQEIRERSPFRITVEDNTGVKGQTTENTNAVIVAKDYIQYADLHLAAGMKDLSGYRFMMYSELFKERVVY